MTAPPKMNSALLTDLLGLGGVVTEYHGRTLVRHFGDPAAEYVAATEAAAVFDRSHRARLSVSGKSPGQMLTGLLTGRIPEAPSSDGSVTSGTGTYHAVLTAKGKMISDLWAYRLGNEEKEVYLLDVPVAGLSGLREHLKRFLPPRLATVHDVSNETAAISVVGPDSMLMLGRLALGPRVDPGSLATADEGAWFCSGVPDSGSGFALDGIMVVRTEEVWPNAWTVYGPADAVRALWRALAAQGIKLSGLGVWTTLRVEAGRPVFGTDMDEKTLPPEVGVLERAIDHTKGCYTGQEVIVRIRDRGHVNKHLRLLDLGDIPTPRRGAELLASDGSGKVVGTLTSVVQSPRAHSVVALGYVRRGVSTVLLDDRSVVVDEIKD